MNGIDGIECKKGTTKITLQIDNNSRSEIVEIFYTIHDQDYQTRLGRQTFFGYFNPTEVFMDTSICAFDDSAKAIFIVYDKADYEHIQLHITTKWEHEKDDRIDVIEVSFKDAACKVISSDSKYMYHYQKIEKEEDYFLLTVLHLCDHQKAEEAAVLNEYGEQEMSVEAYALAAVCFRAAKDKIRSVPKEYVGKLLLEKIDLNNREAHQKSAEKSLNDHFAKLTSYDIINDDEEIAESVEDARKATKYALDNGIDLDHKLVKTFELADKAFFNFRNGKKAETDYLQYKTPAISTCNNQYHYNSAMQKANEAKNYFTTCTTSLKDCKTYWDVDKITSASKPYTDKLTKFGADMDDFIAKASANARQCKTKQPS